MNILKLFRKKKYSSIKEYISEKVGNIHLSIPSQSLDDLDIEVLIIEPTKNKPYFTLITDGLSNYQLKPPGNLETNLFCELVIYLPEYWKVLNPNINFYWPIKSLFQSAYKIVNNYCWVAFSSIISLDQKVSDNSSYNGFILISGVDDEVLIAQKNITFYSLIPVYNEEISFAKQHGGEKLFNEFVENGLVFPPIVNINRNNSKKDFF